MKHAVLKQHQHLCHSNYQFRIKKSVANSPLHIAQGGTIVLGTKGIQFFDVPLGEMWAVVVANKQSMYN